MDNFESLKQEVFARQKTLAEIYYDFGHKTVFDYVNSWQEAIAVPELAALAAQIKALLLETYPADLTEKILLQFSSNPIASTIDHHGILNHPFFINSNLIFGQKQNLKYLLCLTTSGISLNNSSWPAGLLLTGADGKLKRLSFFPDKIKTHPVLGAKALAPRDLDKIFYQIQADAQLSGAEKEKLRDLLENLFSDGKIYSLPDFSRQASVLSMRLWDKIFSNAPAVVYLPLEDLVSRVLINIVAKNSDHFLHSLLFTEDGWNLTEKYFRGAAGGFGNGQKGSFLFWGLDAFGRRTRIYRQGLTLSDGELMTFNLSADGLAAALGDKKLYPTSLVCFLVLLYYNVTCVGGFNQVNWLSEIKQRFLQLLTEAGLSELAQKVATLPTKNFAEGNLAFVKKDGRLIKATGLDIFLNGNNLYENYQKLAQTLTLGQSLETLLPEIYRIVVPKEQLKNQLLKFDDMKITSLNGSMEKIISCLG